MLVDFWGEAAILDMVATATTETTFTDSRINMVNMTGNMLSIGKETAMPVDS